MTIIVFIFVISVLIFVHEFGHFLTARKLGVAVEEFGFGFPPRIFGIRRKGTVYSLNWIPFGGFVKLKGETATSNSEPDSFAVKSRSSRFTIIAAGVIMNYLLSMVLFTVGFSIGVPAAYDANHPDPRIRNIRPQIVSVEPGSPAAERGIAVGDEVVEVNSNRLSRADELKTRLVDAGGGDVSLLIRRDSGERTVIVRPIRNTNNQLRIGVGILDIGTVSYPFPRSLWEGVRTTANVTVQIVVSFTQLIRDIVTTGKVSTELAGPVGVVVLTGQASQLGFPYLIQFVALLSTTLAVINFFPIPALDGGRALFIVIEALRGRAINHRIESLVHAIGFYLLISLVLLVSIRDVQRFDLVTKLMKNIRSILGM